MAVQTHDFTVGKRYDETKYKTDGRFLLLLALCGRRCCATDDTLTLNAGGDHG